MAERIAELIQKGDYYEAQQLTASLASRAQKQQQYAQALQLQHGCITKLLGAGELNSASQLAQQFAKLAIAHPEVYTQEQLGSVFQQFTAGFGTGAPAPKLAFLRTCARLLESNVELTLLINGLLARSYAEDKQYALAQIWFCKAALPEEYASMLLAWAACGYENERDLFLARGVLHLLATGNLKDANIVFTRFLDASQSLAETPLVNFLKFLLLTLERDAYPLFEVLRKKYEPSLSRDPNLRSVLDQVCLVFFNRAPPRPSPFGGAGANPGSAPSLMSMMGPMMQQFLGGMGGRPPQ
jgi:hypothetical protein